MKNLLKKALFNFLLPGFCGYVIYHSTARALHSSSLAEAVAFIILSVAALLALILLIMPRRARRIARAFRPR